MSPEDPTVGSAEGFNCDRVQDLLGAYVFGSLEPGEAAGVTGHLQGCSSCRSEAEELRAAAMQIGESVEAVPPPPMLRESLLSAARRSRVVPLEVPAARPRERWWGAARLAWGAAAIAAVLTLAAGGWGLTEHFSSAARSGPSASSTALTPVDRLIATGQAEVLPLTATADSGAQGALVTDPKTGATYFILTGVPRLSSDRSYTLWYVGIKEGNLQPLAIGEMTHAGAYRLSRAPAGFIKVAVTREPNAHDATPRGPVLLAASLA